MSETGPKGYGELSPLAEKDECRNYEPEMRYFGNLCNKLEEAIRGKESTEKIEKLVDEIHSIFDIEKHDHDIPLDARLPELLTRIEARLQSLLKLSWPNETMEKKDETTREKTATTLRNIWAFGRHSIGKVLGSRASASSDLPGNVVRRHPARQKIESTLNDVRNAKLKGRREFLYGTATGIIGLATAGMVGDALFTNDDEYNTKIYGEPKKFVDASAIQIASGRMIGITFPYPPAKAGLTISAEVSARGANVYKVVNVDEEGKFMIPGSIAPLGGEVDVRICAIHEDGDQRIKSQEKMIIVPAL